ncbi:hypothetical protein GJAV_G00108970 [Gymnothorax javanicus]|nr:hypothetical protein GJAV_G00108970 [Gymnothorax javanicus]
MSVEIVSKPKAAVSTPEKAVKPKKPTSTTPKEKVPESKEMIPVRAKPEKDKADTSITLADKVSAPKTTVLSPEMTVEILSKTTETVSASAKPVPGETTVTTSKENIPISTEVVSKTTVSLPEISVEIISKPTVAASTPAKPVPVDTTTVTTSKENIPISTEVVPKTTVSVAEMTAITVPNPKETLPVAEMAVKAEKATPSPPKEKMIVPKETVPGLEKAETQKMVTTVVEVETSAPKTTISLPEITALVQSIPADMVSTPLQTESMTESKISEETVFMRPQTENNTDKISAQAESAPKTTASATEMKVEIRSIHEESALSPEISVSVEHATVLSPTQKLSITKEAFPLLQKPVDVTAGRRSKREDVKSVSQPADSVPYPEITVKRNEDTVLSTSEAVPDTPETTTVWGRTRLALQETFSFLTGRVTKPKKADSEVITTETTVPIQEEMEKAPKMPLSSSKETVQTVKEPMLPTEDTSHEQKQTLEASEKITSAPERTTLVSQEDASIEETISTPETQEKVEKETIKTTRETSAVSQKPISTLHETAIATTEKESVKDGQSPALHSTTSQQFSMDSTQRVFGLYSKPPDIMRPSPEKDTTTTSTLAPSRLDPSVEVPQSCPEWADLMEDWPQQSPQLLEAPLPTEFTGDIAKQQLVTSQELCLELGEQRSLLGDIAGRCGGTHPPRLTPESQTHAGSYPSEPIGGSTTQEESTLLLSQLEEKVKALESLGMGLPLQVAAPPQIEMPLPESLVRTRRIIAKHGRQSSSRDSGAQGEVGSSTGSGTEGQRESAELVQGFSEQVQVLGGLVGLGRDRLSLAQQPLRSRAQLQILLNGHKKLFQDLGAHAEMLGCLRRRVPADVGGLRAELEQEVGDLQLQAAGEGARLQRTLEAWTQWENSSSQLEQLLQDLEALMPSAAPPQEMEKQLVTYKKLKEALKTNGPWLYQALDQGRALEAGGRGCEGVGVALRRLEARWLLLEQRVEHGRVHAEETAALWNRFREDSVTLYDWTTRARQRLQSWREQTPGAPQELLSQLQGLAKETEAMSSLKASVSRTGAQLLQLKGSDASGLQMKLEQLEQGWADLQAALPSAHEWLHKLLMEKLSLEEVMSELGEWMDGVETGLAEDRAKIRQASNADDLHPLLRRCQDFKVEMAAHQLSLDFAKQAVVQTSSPEERYERISLAERLGALQQRWLKLKGALAMQTHHVEKLQQVCTDRESRLRSLLSWDTCQKHRLETLPQPCALSQARRLVQECEETERQLKIKSAELQELKDSCQSEEGGEECHRTFITQTENTPRELTALGQQLSAVRPTLERVAGKWDRMEGVLEEVGMRTTKTSHILNLASTPQITLLTLQSRIRRLQDLQKEVGEMEQALAELTKTWPSLESAVSPDAALLLSQRLEEEKTRTSAVSQLLTEELQKVQVLLEPWRAYASLSETCLLQLRQRQDQLEALLSNPAQQDDEVEEVRAHLEAVSELQAGMEDLQNSLRTTLDASKDLIGQMEPQASVFIQSETLMLSQDVALLAKSLAHQRRQLQGKLNILQEFHKRLGTLEEHMRDFENRLKSTPKQDQNPKVLLGDLLQLTALTSALDRLNQLSSAVTLSSEASRRLQELSAGWTSASSRAMVTCREVQAEALVRQSLSQRCEVWRCFLEGIDQSIPKEEDPSPPSDPLPKQLTIQRMFLVRAFVGATILNSVVRGAVDQVERGQVEDRCGLLLKLAQVVERWQGAVERSQQWAVLLRGLMGQREAYACGRRLLRNLLSDTDHLFSPSGPAPRSLPQLHQSLEDLKHAETVFQLHQPVYLQTLEAGRALLPVHPQLAEELKLLQTSWEKTQSTVGKRRSLTKALLQNWGCCQTSIADSRQRLVELKDRLNQPMPDLWKDPQAFERLRKEREELLAEGSSSLKDMASKRAGLACHITADDITLLQAPEEGLNSQWEELRLKVSLHEQETADWLGARATFQESGEWLCDWLMQMESAMALGAHLTSAEMAEKLYKDCMEDMKLISDNKEHLKQLGAEETEIRDTLKDVEDRWQLVTDGVMSRKMELQQRQERVQQLRRGVCGLSACGLHTELCRAEARLATPLSYSVCINKEILRRLEEHETLEQDLERISEAVTPVLALCSARDPIGSGGDEENARLRESALSLERRWKEARALCSQQRNSIVETQQLWRQYLDDRGRFADWLREAEQTASAKQEVEKLQALQKEIEEHFAQLELLNTQYQRMAQENLADEAGSHKGSILEVNHRWDALQQQVETTLQTLKVVREQPDQSGRALVEGAELISGSGSEVRQSSEEDPQIQQAVAQMLAASLGQGPAEDQGGSSAFKEEAAAGASVLGAMSGVSSTEPSSLALSASPISTRSGPGYAEMMSECSGSIDRVRKVSLILDDEEQPAEDQGISGLSAADTQSGVIQRWEVIQAMSPQTRRVRDLPQSTSDLKDVIAWLRQVIPELERLQGPKRPSSLSIQDMEANVQRLKEMQRTFDRYKSRVIALNLSVEETGLEATGEVEGEAGLRYMDQGWVKAGILLDQWKEKLRASLMRCQEYHQTLHSMLLWLARAETRCLAVDARDPALTASKMRERDLELAVLERELQVRLRQVGSLQDISAQLLPEYRAEAWALGEDSSETQEKLHVVGNKLQVLLRQVAQDRQVLRERLGASASLEPESETVSAQERAGETGAVAAAVEPETARRSERRDQSPPRSFFARVLRAAFPLHLLLLLLLMLACLIPPWQEDGSCALSNNFARSLYPMLHYTNGPPPT